MWEILFAMERCDYRAGDEGPGATTLVLDLAKPFERVYVSLPVVCGLERRISILFWKILRVL